MGGIGCGLHAWTDWERVPFRAPTPSYFVRYCRHCGQRQTTGNGEKHGG